MISAKRILNVNVIAKILIVLLLATVFNLSGQDSFASSTTFSDDDITIGITYSDNQERTAAAVEKVGAKAYALPIATNKAEARAALSHIDALIISGGSSIAPIHYGYQNSEKIENVAPERDISDMLMIREAKELDMPVIGICRGMQVMNVVQGGTLYQDINAEYPTPGEGAVHRDPALKNYVDHLINIEEDSKLYGIVNTKTLSVKSYHHQAVKDLGKDLIVTATADDGIIEAFEFTNQTFMMGIQFHPEASVAIDNNVTMLGFFSKLKELGKAYREKVFPTLTAPYVAVAYLYEYNRAKVCWDLVDDASGYAVYYKLETSESYELLGRTSQNYLITDPLADGTKYDFMVVPYLERSGNYYNVEGYKTASVCTLRPMETPQIINYYDTGLTMAWTTSIGMDGYQISRSTSATGTRVVSTKKSIFEVSRNVKYGEVIGQPYYYKVRAYKLVGGVKVKGPWSAPVMYIRQLPAPTIAKATIYKTKVIKKKNTKKKTVKKKVTNKNDVVVSWSKVEGASGYAVYYKKSTNTKYSLVGRTDSSKIIKKSLLKGKTYDFKVVPYLQNGKTIYNSINSITTSLKLPKAKRIVKSTKSTKKK